MEVLSYWKPKNNNNNNNNNKHDNTKTVQETHCTLNTMSIVFSIWMIKQINSAPNSIFWYVCGYCKSFYTSAMTHNYKNHDKQWYLYLYRPQQYFFTPTEENWLLNEFFTFKSNRLIYHLDWFEVSNWKSHPFNSIQGKCIALKVTAKAIYPWPNLFSS